MLFFGVAFGVVCGHVTVTACRFLYNQLTIEGPVVLAMSYFCFWLGEVRPRLRLRLRLRLRPRLRLSPNPNPNHPDPNQNPSPTPSPTPTPNQLICGTSAVISVVTMGLWVNYYRAHISAEVTLALTLTLTLTPLTLTLTSPPR